MHSLITAAAIVCCGAQVAVAGEPFGATFSVPHGTGAISGNTVQFTIAYADGPFRDTLRYDPEAGTWILEIEASQPGGAWQHFARYDIRRN